MIRRYWWMAGLLAAVAIVAILAPLASSDPDGLERVAQDIGFAEQGQDAAFEVLPGYTVPVLGDGGISLIAAGIIGVALLFAGMWLLGRVLARRDRATD